MSGGQKISWGRLVAESTAIIASILLAFAIDAWWADRLERAEELELLGALNAELQENVDQIRMSLEFREAAVDATTVLLRAWVDKTELPEARFDQLLGSIVWWERADLADGALNAIVQGGLLRLIEDSSLRFRIASLSAKYEELGHSEEQHFDTYKNQLLPYMHKRVGLAQISNAQRTKPGVGTFPQPVLPTGETRDHRVLLDDPVFEALLTNLIWDHNDAATALTQLELYLIELNAEINQSLKD